VSGDLTFDVVGAQGPRRFFAALDRTPSATRILHRSSGTGKKTFARRLAQAMLCRRRVPAPGLRRTCDSCRLFSAGEDTRNPDFIEHTGVMKIGDPDKPLGFYEATTYLEGPGAESFAAIVFWAHARAAAGDGSFATPESANHCSRSSKNRPPDV